MHNIYDDDDDAKSENVEAKSDQEASVNVCVCMVVVCVCVQMYILNKIHNAHIPLYNRICMPSLICRHLDLSVAKIDFHNKHSHEANKLWMSLRLHKLSGARQTC